MGQLASLKKKNKKNTVFVAILIIAKNLEKQKGLFHETEKELLEKSSFLDSLDERLTAALLENKSMSTKFQRMHLSSCSR